MYDEYINSVDSSVCHKLWSILWSNVQVCSLTINYRVVQFVPNINILKTIWEHTCDNSPTDFISSSLKWWSSMHGVDTLQSCWVVLLANSQISLHTFLCMTFHIIRPWRNTKIFRVWKLFCSTRSNSRFKHSSVIVHNIFAYFTLSLSAACVLRAPRRLSPSVFWGAPRGEHLSTHHALLASWPRASWAHPVPATPFQWPRSRTATLRRGPQLTFHPYVGLTVHWAVSVRRSTTGRWPSR